MKWTKERGAFIVFIFAFIKLSCSSSSTFRVISSTPQAGERQVPLNSDVIVTFNEVVDYQSLLLNTETNIPHPVFFLEALGKKLHIKSAIGTLEGNREYFVHIRQSLRSISGKKLESDFYLSFLTEKITPEVKLELMKDIYGARDETLIMKISSDETWNYYVFVNNAPALSSTYDAQGRDQYVYVSTSLLNAGENTLRLVFVNDEGFESDYEERVFYDPIPPEKVTDTTFYQGRLYFSPVYDEPGGVKGYYAELTLSVPPFNLSKDVMCEEVTSPLPDGYPLRERCGNFPIIITEGWARVVAVDVAGNYSEGLSTEISYYKKFNMEVTGSVLASTTCEINGDGEPDFMSAVSQAGGLYLRIFSGAGIKSASGNVIYPASSTYITSISYPSADLACSDVNGDGLGDLILGVPYASGGTSAVYVFHGIITLPGKPGAIFPYSSTGLGRDVAVGDFNGDGNPDIFAGNPEADEVRVFEGPVTKYASSQQILSSPPGAMHFGEKVVTLNQSRIDKSGIFAYESGSPVFYLYSGDEMIGILPALSPDDSLLGVSLPFPGSSWDVITTERSFLDGIFYFQCSNGLCRFFHRSRVLENLKKECFVPEVSSSSADLSTYLIICTPSPSAPSWKRIYRINLQTESYDLLTEIIFPSECTRFRASAFEFTFSGDKQSSYIIGCGSSYYTFRSNW